MAASRYTFGPFLLDGDARTLSRDGTVLPLGQRAIALLQALVEADGTPVTKAALMERAWPVPSSRTAI